MGIKEAWVCKHTYVNKAESHLLSLHFSDNLVSVPSIKVLNLKIVGRYKCRCTLVCHSDLVLSVKQL